MKRDKTRDDLREVAAAAEDPSSPASVETIRRGLASRRNLVVARAARAVGEARLEALAADVAAAFPRLIEDPAARDPTCAGKLEIARCLLELDHPAPEIFLAGVRHVQKEKAWGPPVDTAAELRGTCALALITTRHPDGPYEAVRLLADPEPVARAGGLRALGACTLPGAELALRLHVLRGESEPDVLAEALGSLLHADFERSLPFVAGLLDHDDETTMQCAALALGDSRREEALAPLRARLEGELRQDLRRALILAMATLRTDAAFGAVLELVERGSAHDHAVAVEALGVYAHDAALQDRLRDARARRGPGAGSR